MEKDLEKEYLKKEVKDLRRKIEELKEAEGALNFILRNCGDYASEKCLYCSYQFCDANCDSYLSLESRVVDYLERRKASRNWQSHLSG